ncbi:hypothetical protein, partial [Edaphobacter sp. HDX4]|uniref:hypothetical protein n=1 Tax=Edaphobacter sp. HDX4 TaxID=2794064 RepID=UPI002FE5414C
SQTLECAQQLGQIFALRDDSHIFFERQNPGSARTKDDLVISEMIRFMEISCNGVFRPVLLSSAPSGPPDSCVFNSDKPPLVEVQ